MKKLSLMLGALALVLGLSQCRKQETPVQAGEKQYIELTASNGNDGSKVDVDFLPSVMNLTWEAGDVITVSGGAEGTLTLDGGAGTAQGHFLGEIEKKNNDDLVFSYRKAIPSKGDDVIDFYAQDGTQTWIKDNLYLEAKVAYNESGKYSVLMEMPYAVLKLDLSALVGTQNDVTVKAGGVILATVTDLAAVNASEVYVAVPTDGSKQTYTFSGHFWNVKKIWTLATNTYYTAEGGEAVAIVPEIKFTVDDNGTTVEFAPGLMYWDGDSFEFETNQWSFSNTWNTNHVSHFFYQPYSCMSNSYSSPYSGTEAVTSDVFFTNKQNIEDADKPNPEFTVNGETGVWRSLSKAEWSYLLSDKRGTAVTGVDNIKTLSVSGSTTTVRGLVIFPDDSNMPLDDITTTEDLATYSAVFLPVAGYRSGSKVGSVGSYGYTWSSTPNKDVENKAYCLYFGAGGVFPNNDTRSSGFTVRLVR